MTVGELRQILERYDIDAPVVVAGYEYGLADVDRVLGIGLALNANQGSYGGPHNEDKDGKPAVLIASSADGRNG